ncbi:MAG: hypothetical protein U9R48_10850 [Chloroflexota bacterium]|nr:hypothetical protein [Chloroflexota bacterium]
MWNECFEDGEMQSSTPFAQERVLVGIVPRLADWKRVCEEHWYRIPVARAPQRIAAEYLAFYHPKVFQELRWTITYYAPIRAYHLVRRGELLPEETGHPRRDDLYYKIEIGPLQRLPRPISSRKLRRVTFILTTLSRLYQAREINDLWVKEKANAPLERAFRIGEKHWTTPDGPSFRTLHIPSTPYSARIPGT